MAVLEKEATVGAHQTGHNSGVIHGGIYYAPSSLKAKLCVEGARMLYDYCSEHGILFERCGKVILATRPAELPRLNELERRGRQNQVPGLRRISPAELAEIEPHASGLDGLYSPATGIVDFGGVARALADEVAATGTTVSTSCEVTGVRPGSRSLVLRHPLGDTEASHVVFCAGAWADQLAVSAGASPEPRILPFRGAYLRLRPERRSLVRGLIYPVPDPRLPFLGVHLSRQIDGEVLVGPTALLVGARDAYDLMRIRVRDVNTILRWPGTWRMIRRFWRPALTEVRHAASRAAFVASAARYVAALEPDDVISGPTGVRAQALARDGRLVDDFVFSHTARALHVRNAPSPAATSSLAIARLIADEAQRTFSLDDAS